MRIIVMGNNDMMGGLIVHYITLTKYLKNAGHSLLLINVNDKSAKLYDSPDIREIIIPFRTTTFFQKITKFIKLNQAIKIGKRFKPDIFISTGYGYGYLMIANGLERKTFKIFEEVHFEPHEVSLKLKMVNRFDAVAPQTQGMVPVFKKNISSQKPVVYLPCFSKEYTEQNYQQIPGGESTIKLAYFGRLEWNKGIRQFVSYTGEQFKGSGLTLDIYGKGSEGASLQDDINFLGLGNHIKMKGYYKDDEFAQLISSYHGIIVPSVDTEGLPLILIEAMRYGRPILCTVTGAMPEVAEINKNGMIVSEQSQTELNKNLKLFVNMLRANIFSATYINGIYKSFFSNDSFWKIWEKMLHNPEEYFKSGEGNPG